MARREFRPVHAERGKTDDIDETLFRFRLNSGVDRRTRYRRVVVVGSWTVASGILFVRVGNTITVVTDRFVSDWRRHARNKID